MYGCIQVCVTEKSVYIILYVIALTGMLGTVLV